MPLQASNRITTTSLLVAVLSTWSLSISTSRRCGPRRRSYLLTTHRETKQKTLEEIAAAFGDHLVEVDENGLAAERLAMEAKADPIYHVEDKNAA